MDFEVYCDESGLEALTDKSAHSYLVIGGIWIRSEYRNNLKENLKAIRRKYNINGEMKWQKISPTYFTFYKEIIEYFFSDNELRFRAIVVETNKVDNIKFNKSDAELSFYKFYYQLLHHWIFDFNSYDIFVDFKVNRDGSRLSKLSEILNTSNITSEINQIQQLHSGQSLGIQLADILIGLVAAKFNNKIKRDSAKYKLIEFIEKVCLRKSLTATPKWDEKFNVFKINLQGGW